MGRQLVVIAESDLNQPRIVTPREAGGYGLDAQWNDDFHHALHTVLTGESTGYLADFGSVALLAKTLTRGFVYDGTYSKSRRRKHGAPVSGLSAHRFVAFLQNHDQVGNRAMGERLGHLLTIDQLKIAAALLMSVAVCPDVISGRGVERVDSVSVLHRSPGRAARRVCAQRPPGGIRAFRRQCVGDS